MVIRAWDFQRHQVLSLLCVERSDYGFINFSNALRLKYEKYMSQCTIRASTRCETLIIHYENAFFFFYRKIYVLCLVFAHCFEVKWETYIFILSGNDKHSIWAFIIRLYNNDLKIGCKQQRPIRLACNKSMPRKQIYSFTHYSLVAIQVSQHYDVRLLMIFYFFFSYEFDSQRTTASISIRSRHIDPRGQIAEDR